MAFVHYIIGIIVIVIDRSFKLENNDMICSQEKGSEKCLFCLDCVAKADTKYAVIC